ncbi:hypothetical protein P3T73_10115 [Kiritimatiellota bacterium B12222]|nr:hypothetical protein P3T73_10115 [Kiritimatiellota bacterium B12222]
MRRIVVTAIGIAVMALCSCSVRAAQDDHADQGASKAQLNKTNPSATINTELALKALIESIKAGDEKKNVTLVGVLNLGSNPKLDPSKLTIGNASVQFGHHLDKDKYDKKTVLIKADIRNADGLTWDAQVQGNMIVNVQHVEIVEQP